MSMVSRSALTCSCSLTVCVRTIVQVQVAVHGGLVGRHRVVHRLEDGQQRRQVVLDGAAQAAFAVLVVLGEVELDQRRVHRREVDLVDGLAGLGLPEVRRQLDQADALSAQQRHRFVQRAGPIAQLGRQAEEGRHLVGRHVLLEQEAAAAQPLGELDQAAPGDRRPHQEAAVADELAVQDAEEERALVRLAQQAVQLGRRSRGRASSPSGARRSTGGAG